MRSRIRTHIKEFDKQVDQARDVRKADPGKLSPYQRKLLELNEKINTFMVEFPPLSTPARF